MFDRFSRSWELIKASGSVLRQDKELLVFDGSNGGAAHCQFDNHLPALLACADWLVDRLEISTRESK